MPEIVKEFVLRQFRGVQLKKTPCSRERPSNATSCVWLADGVSASKHPVLNLKYAYQRPMYFSFCVFYEYNKLQSSASV